MQSAIRIAICLFIITFSAAMAYQGSTKLRRDGLLNMYPFPRVGRSSHHTWELPLDDLDYEYKPSQKRQMYAFPRIGRNEFSFRAEPLHSEQFQAIPLRLEDILFNHPRSHPFVKRESESTDSSGMWFGPRLGRGFKSEEDDIVIENNSPNESDQSVSSHNEERKKRQTKQM